MSGLWGEGCIDRWQDRGGVWGLGRMREGREGVEFLRTHGFVVWASYIVLRSMEL
jgi:hypothetical protein